VAQELLSLRLGILDIDAQPASQHVGMQRCKRDACAFTHFTLSLKYSEAGMLSFFFIWKRQQIRYLQGARTQTLLGGRESSLSYKVEQNFFKGISALLIHF
jgi:hypothetical protein